MKILLIGNGFDLAHNLPTTYNSFLDVCNGLISEGADSFIPNRIYKDYCDSVSTADWVKMKSLIINNAWIHHFRYSRSSLGDKWGDFESEIEYVINKFYEEMISLGKDKRVTDTHSRINSHLRNKYTQYNNTYNQLFGYLYLELKELTMALGLYFSSFVEKKSIEQKALFLAKDINKLLSFNYTSTYLEKYPAFDVEDFEYCYIHGETTKSNMVLGFDDHYLESGESHLKTVPFEKYYQRIVNRNDNVYLKWLDEIEQKELASELVVFGHSLTPSDGDILEKYICCPHVKTKIYYLNEEDRAEKVANLAIVLGPDKLIELAGGLNPIIEFIEIK